MFASPHFLSVLFVHVFLLKMRYESFIHATKHHSKQHGTAFVLLLRTVDLIVSRMMHYKKALRAAETKKTFEPWVMSEQAKQGYQTHFRYNNFLIVDTINPTKSNQLALPWSSQNML